jgi:hypothetical protein
MEPMIRGTDGNDGLLTLADLRAFVDMCEQIGVDPASRLKAGGKFNGIVKWIQVQPPPDRT